MEARLLIAFVRSGDQVLTADVLQLGNELWLVPLWLESLDGQWQMPGRAIRVDRLPHQWFPDGGGPKGSDLVLQFLVPKAVLDGETTSTEEIQFEVVEGPSDRLRVPKRQVQ